MVHIICTKNDSNMTNKYWDLAPGGQKCGRMDARTTQKYIPLTSSVDNKQAKSNGNIDKKKRKSTVHRKSKQLNNWNKVFIIWNRSDAIYAKCNKKKYAYYQRIM